MEVLLIEKDTFDCILDEHGLLCDMIINLASHLRKKKPEELMSAAEVCDFLNIGTTTLQTLRNSGKIGFVREDNNRVGYPCREVIDYLERNGISPNAFANGRGDNQQIRCTDYICNGTYPEGV